MDTSDDSPRIYNGQIRRVVDEKNRINIPSRWRDAHISEFNAMRDRKNPCLKLLNTDELRRMKRTLDESTALTPAEKKKFRRRWFSRAMPCPIDKQGRIVVPPELQEQYKFSGEVVIVGACECLELWRPEDWVGEENADDMDVDSIA
ncbi:MAG: division/cell wall cluster transcriptional repressor MraZ, partial [Verrucomicrobiales bacterium]